MFAGQHNGADSSASLFFYPATQIRQCTSLPDEVVHHHVFTTPIDLAPETGLTGEAAITIRTRMGNDIGLYNDGLIRDTGLFAQK